MQMQTTTHRLQNRMLIGKSYCGGTIAPGSQKTGLFPRLGSIGKSKSLRFAFKGSPTRMAPWKARDVREAHRIQPHVKARDIIASKSTFGSGGRWVTGCTISQRANKSQAGENFGRSPGNICAEKLPHGEKDTWVLQLEIDHCQKHVGRGLANGGYSPEKLWSQG